MKKLIAQLWQWYYQAQDRASTWQNSRVRLFLAAISVTLIAISFGFSTCMQHLLNPYLSNQTSNLLANLRGLFLGVGCALIGASAIAFSLVVFAMQVNVERMPHGLFRKLCADTRIILSFAGTFLIAILIACASLIPNSSWVANSIIASAWGVILVFGLFLFAYRRALVLINPLQQLNILAKSADRSINVWVKRAKRITPLLKGVAEHEDGSPKLLPVVKTAN